MRTTPNTLTPHLIGVIFAALLYGANASASAQSRSQSQVSLTVSLKGTEPNVSLVQNFVLLIHSVERGAPDSFLATSEVTTSADGAAALTLPPGHYLVKSKNPLTLDASAYEWSIPFEVVAGRTTRLDLNDSNVSVARASDALRQGRITGTNDLLSVLGPRVVTVIGEVAHGSGVIAHGRGVVLTSAHLIRDSEELSVQFDARRKVGAKLLGIDQDRQIAALRIDLTNCQECLPPPPPSPPSAMTPSAPPAEGDRVLLISSASPQKSLAAGVITGVNGRYISASVAIDNLNAAGSPLFDARGDLIGMIIPSAAAGNDQKVSGPAIVGAEALREFVARSAHAMDDSSGPPSAELLPVEPTDNAPPAVWANKAGAKKFDDKVYRMDVGKYQVSVITPVLKSYIMEADKNRIVRQRAKQGDGASSAGVGGTAYEPARDSFYNLRNWAAYFGEVRPVVHVVAIPEVRPTGKSLFLGAVVGGVGALGGGALFMPLDFKFKADFKELRLSCDGRPITPIRRGKIEFVAPLQSYFKVKNNTAFAGLYTYPAEAFAAGKCAMVELEITSEEAGVAEKKALGARLLQRVWEDFAEYRQHVGDKR